MHSSFMFQVIALLCSPSLIAASPLTTPNIGPHLYPRTNPCQPGGTPILYQEYYADLCPPSITMNADGSCPISEDFASSTCIGYCEVRQEFFYDQEQPVIDNPYCHGPLTCTVSISQAFTYTYQGGGSISLGILAALTLGITGGLSYASATTQLQSTSIALPAGQCGYFTFLPQLHTSCGSLTELTSPSTGGGSGGTCQGGTTTTGNYCTTQAARTADGKGVLGATIFVKTDCSNNARLPLDQQDPAYQHDGVAAPQSVYNDFITEFVDCVSDCDTPVCLDPADCELGFSSSS